MYSYFSTGNGQPTEPALCQLYRHAFVRHASAESQRRLRTFAGDRQVRPRLGSGTVDDKRRLSGDLVSVVARDVHLSLVRVLMAAYRPSAFHQRDRRTAHHCSILAVDGSCAKHFTIELYTVVMPLTFILITITIQSPPRFFIPGLKPSFSANPFHRSLRFLLMD